VGVTSCAVCLGSPPSPTLPRKGGGSEASRGGGEEEPSSRVFNASRFATSPLVPFVEARARCAAASPPARRSQELSGGGCKLEFFLSLPPCKGGGLGRAVLSIAERGPVVDPTPASPRLIAGLSSSASAGPIGRTSGREALELGVFDFGVLPGFLGLSGFFAISRIWDESGAEKRAKAGGGTTPGAAAFPVSRWQHGMRGPRRRVGRLALPPSLQGA